MKLAPFIAVALLAGAGQTAFGATEDLGKGFAHHGVATPNSNHRGIVATQDGQGRDVVLLWLFDHTGGYALLMIDAETGKSEQFPMPFASGGDCPYSSILSTGNKFYTHFNSYFCEFDPVKRAFTFSHQTAPQMAMGMTEDDNGVIWSVTYPQSGVVSFNPKTREFKDYGQVYKQNWQQYQRYVATDDAGWLYFGIGNTTTQIIALDPKTGQAKPMLPDAERVAAASASVYRDLDGKVYGQAGGKSDWYEFYKGEGRKIGKHDQVKPKPIITSHQGLFHQEFPDGKRLVTCDTVNRVLVVEDPKTKETKRLQFDYTSEGAHVMGLATAPDGTICGGTAFPMRFFSYNPKTDQWVSHDFVEQCNTVARQGDHFFVGGYGGGVLLEWDPFSPWTFGAANPNPANLIQAAPEINRPHKLLAHPDGKTLVLAGTPGYGRTGGGLLIWDRETHKGRLIEHTALLPEQATASLVALPGDKLLGGTTTEPGTGGEKKAKEAELYVMDMATGKIEWHQAVLPGVQDYTDMCSGPTGLVYGFTDRARFFVFDPAKRQVVHQEDAQAKFGLTCSQQGPRVFVFGRNGAIYILFVKGIAKLDPATFSMTLLAESPVPIGLGGDYLDGRIYFGNGSHVYSYKLAE
jgi:hypothetical protein